MLKGDPEASRLHASYHLTGLVVGHHAMRCDGFTSSRVTSRLSHRWSSVEFVPENDF